jgi:hypothetical protein
MNAKKLTAQHKTKSAIAKLRRPNIDMMAGEKITSSTKIAIPQTMRPSEV